MLKLIHASNIKPEQFTIKRLRRVARHLEGVGTCLQYSVFECGPQAWQDGKLRQALCSHIEPARDV